MHAYMQVGWRDVCRVSGAQEEVFYTVGILRSSTDGGQMLRRLEEQNMEILQFLWADRDNVRSVPAVLLPRPGRVGEEALWTDNVG
jgi:hypothetical protein